MKLQKSDKNNGLSAFYRFLQFYISAFQVRKRCRFLTFFRFIIGFGYGRFIIADFKRFTQRFYFFRLVLCICLGLFCWLSPIQVLAEFNDTDSTRLFNLLNKTDDIYENLLTLKQFQNAALTSGGSGVATIANEIETNTFQSYNKLVGLVNALGYSTSYDNDTLKFDLQTVRNYQAANGTLLAAIVKGLGSQSQTTWYGETIGEKLDKIITALESEDTGTGSGSEIPSDIATETTLLAFKGKYEEIANQFLNSWGFSGGSGGTFRESLSYILPKTNTTTRFAVYSISPTTDLGEISPFPVSGGTGGSWKPFMVPMFASSYRNFSNNFVEDFSFILGENLYGLSTIQQENMKKQAWNDWFAHTNMVAQIVKQVDRIVLPPENGRQNSIFNPETGSIETPSFGSSSAETVDLKPSYTNEFAQIEQSSESVTNSFDFLKSDEIKNRYISDNMLNMGEFRDYGSVGSGFNGIWKIGDFVIDFSNSNTYYREIISTNTLSIVRNSMSYIWTFCSILAAFWFVIKIGGISQD